MTTEIKRSIIINVPVEKVFEYASNYLNWPKFIECVSNFKTATEITRGNGTKFIYKAKMLGLNVTLGTEIQQFKENEGWIGKSFKGMEHQTGWNFKKINGKTELTYTLKYNFPIARFIDKKFVQPLWIKLIENSFQNLKSIMEKD